MKVRALCNLLHGVTGERTCCVGQIYTVKEIVEDPNIILEVWEEESKIVLDRIVIPIKLRKQGIGSKIMRMVCEYGDKVNKPIYLTPSTSFGGSSVNRLKEFYKRFGFVKNPESGPFRHVMVRYPV